MHSSAREVWREYVQRPFLGSARILMQLKVLLTEKTCRTVSRLLAEVPGRSRHKSEGGAVALGEGARRARAQKIARRPGRREVTRPRKRL